MACSNCFNGCVDIVSDQCVRYTGIDVPSLGIQNGDPLSRIEQSLITFLQSALDGTGIKPHIDIPICDLVRNNLPTCGDFTIVDYTTALIKSACDLQEQVSAIVIDVATINNTLAELNSIYALPGCLTGTIDANSTHSVLQAVISDFCALSNSLPSTYVKLDDIDSIINDWFLANQPNSLISNKMVPYVAVPFFDPDIAGKFDSTGKGIDTTIWKNIYLCNGNNPGVPDLRGVVPVGRTDMGANTFNAIVNPATPGNPTYSSFGISGANTITLQPAQMPTHTHTATTAPFTHSHYSFNSDVITGNSPYLTNTTYPVYRDESNDNSSYRIMGSYTPSTLGLTSDVTITLNTINANAGSSESHSNIQPVIACYYIIYIP